MSELVPSPSVDPSQLQGWGSYVNRGKLTGQGRLIHYAVFAESPVLTKENPVARHGEMLFVSADFPGKPKTDSQGEPLPTQADKLLEFAAAEEAAKLEAAQQAGKAIIETTSRSSALWMRRDRQAMNFLSIRRSFLIPDDSTQP